MKFLTQIRDDWSDTETMGVLTFGGKTLQTIERPWISTDPGGKSRESCIPAGRFLLRPHARRNGDVVVALVNPGHAVYYLDEDRPNVGRFLILIHSANWVHQIMGCIAPGKTRTQSDQGMMVTSSRSAMRQIMEYIDGDEAVIDITWKHGEPE